MNTIGFSARVLAFSGIAMVGATFQSAAFIRDGQRLYQPIQSLLRASAQKRPLSQFLSLLPASEIRFLFVIGHGAWNSESSPVLLFGSGVYQTGRVYAAELLLKTNNNQ
jgi:hypothetical protein